VTLTEHQLCTIAKFRSRAHVRNMHRAHRTSVHDKPADLPLPAGELGGAMTVKAHEKKPSCVQAIRERRSTRMCERREGGVPVLCRMPHDLFCFFLFVLCVFIMFAILYAPSGQFCSSWHWCLRLIFGGGCNAAHSYKNCGVVFSRGGKVTGSRVTNVLWSVSHGATLCGSSHHIWLLSRFSLIKALLFPGSYLW